MNVEIGEKDVMLERAASIIVELVRSKPNATIGLATGRSPTGLYERLIRSCHSGEVDFGQCRFVQLDEYVGLARDDHRCYQNELRRRFLDPVGVEQQQFLSLDVWAPSRDSVCATFEAALERLGGVDLQLLGIGANGHIGFNEPMSSLASLTRTTRLQSSTRRDAAAMFGRDEDVPTEVVTQGIGTVLRARQLLVLAFGGAKATALAAALEGPVRCAVPASALQMHPHAVVLVDHEAAAGLTFASEYAAIDQEALL